MEKMNNMPTTSCRDAQVIDEFLITKKGVSEISIVINLHDISIW